MSCFTRKADRRCEGRLLLRHEVLRTKPQNLKVVGPPCLSHSVFQVVLHKSIPTQVCQLILDISSSKEQVDGFVGELTSAKRL